MNLHPIERSGQRVLTTAQLAESFGTDAKIINRNFQRNADRYKHGKHYFSLTGEELREFKGSRQFDDSLKYISVLYLWTEKGAWLHAKSLNTDEAWDVYEMLVDEYYHIKENALDLSMLSPELRALINIEKKQIEQEQKMQRIEGQVNNISNIVTMNNVEWRKKVNAILNKIAQNWTGIDPFKSVRNYSYEKLEQRAGCKLDIRLNNRKERAIAQGMSKTYVSKISKLDCIAEEKRLTEIYIQVIKEMAIQFRVNINDFKFEGVV